MYTEVEHMQGPSTTNLYPANTRVVGYGSEVREGMSGGRERDSLFWGSHSDSFRRDVLLG